MKNSLKISNIWRAIGRFFKKEIMLSVSLAAAIASLFITPPSGALLKDIDWRTLATLFMLITVLEGFKKENIFAPVLKLTGNFKSIVTLTCFFVYSVFLSSMFVTNDVSLIVFVPLTIIMFRQNGKERYIIPVLTLENIAAIRGSLLTPFGSPQNLFLFSRSGVSVQSFLLRMLPLWLFSALLLFVFIRILYVREGKKTFEKQTETNNVKELAPEMEEKISSKFGETSSPSQKTGGSIGEKNNLLKRIIYVTLFLVVVASIVTRTTWWPFVALFVTLVLLIFDTKIFLKTDYVLILTFFCFFVFSSSVCANPKISGFLSSHVSGHEYLWSILISQVISNVPAAIVLEPFSNNLTALLYGLDSAGLCSIIGSLASVINLRLYVREYPGKAGKFIFTFTWISLLFFSVVVFPQLLLLGSGIF